VGITYYGTEIDSYGFRDSDWGGTEIMLGPLLAAMYGRVRYLLRMATIIQHKYQNTTFNKLTNLLTTKYCCLRDVYFTCS
jgi:hypothetical protein